jgi:hypothetical protein
MVPAPYFEEDSLSEIERLDELVGQINEEHRRCEEALRSGLSHALRAGELLTEAKSRVHHGEWLPWLEANFEASVRTAQGYMRLYTNREALEANTQPVAHFGIAGALKELAAPSEAGETDGGPPEDALLRTEKAVKEIAAKDDGERNTAEFPVGYVRSMLEVHGPGELSDEVLKGVEERLAQPSTREWELCYILTRETLRLLGAQVKVDGFLLEEAKSYPPRPAEMQEDASPVGLVLSYRTLDKKKIFAVPVPVRSSSFLAEHADRIKRGCEQYALHEFKVWRILANWVTEVLIAYSSDLPTIEKRVAHNADWRKAEPVADYLHDKLYERADIRRRAAECGVSVKEFRDMVGGVEVWLDIRAHHLRQRIAPELQERA